MENNKESITFKFQKLTPETTSEIPDYEQALEFVFQKGNEDLRNIAITGIFGSGKSSVIRSFADKHRDLSFIYVSLAHFTGVSGEDKDDYSVIIEEKIINHVVQQIPSKYTADSGFRIKKKYNKWNGIWLSFRIAFLLLIVASLYILTTVRDLQQIQVFGNVTGANLIPISLGVGFAIILSLIYSIVKLFNTRKKIKAFDFKVGSVEIENQSEKSYFDQHLDEILYLLSNAQVDAIVFEDIDRFETIDLKVLEHLRELCTLANNRMKVVGSKKKTIRFIYLIGDHVFETNTDRTKFFDYMIPIIPVVDASNSYAKLKECLEGIEVFDAFNDRFLRGLCLYLDDYRTIKNVANEFQIYSSKLSSTAQNPNQLLALIVYKNQYPEDFSELQQGKGYLFRVLSNKSELCEKKISKTENEIEELKNKLEIIEKETASSEEELKAIDEYRRLNPNRFNDYSYNEWKNKVFPIRSDSIRARSSGDSLRIREQIVEKQRSLPHIRNMHLHELINDRNENSVFEYDVVVETKNSKTKPIRNKNNNQLVEFLVKGGYIDETTYRDYIALFYEKGMSLNDKEFLIAVNSRNGKAFDYKINNLDLVIDNLEPDDFIQPELRNFFIIDYLLEKDLDDHIRMFDLQMQENKDLNFVSQFLRVTKHRISFISSLNKYWPGAMVALTSSNNQDMTFDEIQEYLITSFAHIDAEELKVQNRDNLVTLFVNLKFSFASCETEDCCAIGESLSIIDVKFTDIDKQLDSDALRDVVYKKNLYTLTGVNIKSILQHEYGLSTEHIKNRELSAVLSDPTQSLAIYVKENIIQFMNGYITENDEINDDLSVSEYVVNNSEITKEQKDQYISLMSEPFESLGQIREEIWKTVLIYSRVKCNADEILRFYSKFGLASELVGFINQTTNSIDYSSCEDKGELKRFYNDSVKNNDISDEHYKTIVQQIGNPITQFAIPGLNEGKIGILIEANLIPMNLQNFLFIQKYYPKSVCKLVGSDPNGYITLGLPSSTKPDILIMLLGDPKIELVYRRKIADQMKSPISISGKAYDDEMFIYILNNKYDPKDLSCLIENYQFYSSEVQEAAYKRIREQIASIDGNIKELASDLALLSRIFSDESISVYVKCNLLDLLITNECRENLETLLLKMGFSNMTKLVSGDTSRLPMIKNGAEEKAVLSVLKKHGYIVDFSANDNEPTIRIIRK